MSHRLNDGLEFDQPGNLSTAATEITFQKPAPPKISVDNSMALGAFGYINVEVKSEAGIKEVTASYWRTNGDGKMYFGDLHRANDGSYTLMFNVKNAAEGDGYGEYTIYIMATDSEGSTSGKIYRLKV